MGVFYDYRQKIPWVAGKQKFEAPGVQPVIGILFPNSGESVIYEVLPRSLNYLRTKDHLSGKHVPFLSGESSNNRENGMLVIANERLDISRLFIRFMGKTVTGVTIYIFFRAGFGIVGTEIQAGNEYAHKKTCRSKKPPAF
jgi:hypothetical protein